MGSSGGGGGGEMEETQLSKEQAKILKSREAFYQKLTQPELEKYFGETKEFELNNNYNNFSATEFAEQQVSTMNDSFGAQREQLSNVLAQRGMEGSGVEASTLTQLAGAQAQAIGATVNQARLQSILQKNNIVDKKNQNALSTQGVRQSGINSLLSQSPQPTSAAPMGQSSGGGGGSGWGGAALGVVGSMAGGPAGGIIAGSLFG